MARQKTIDNRNQDGGTAATAVADIAPDASPATSPDEFGVSRSTERRSTAATDLLIDAIWADDNHRRPTADEQEKLTELAESMKLAGQMQPIRVHALSTQERGGPSGALYRLAFGFRRLAAAKLLGWKTIWAEVLPAVDDSIIQAERAIENVARLELNPAEEAVAVARLLKAHEGDAARVAAILGKTTKNAERWVRDRATLNRLCDELLNLVADGTLPLAHARVIAQLPEKADQIEVAAKALGAEDYHYNGGNSTYSMDWKDLAERHKDGSVQVASIEDVQVEVQNVTRDLKRVPWKLELQIAIPAKGKKPAVVLPACVGCPSNSKSDPVLFEGVVTDDEGGGTCLNRGCFEMKAEACEGAKADAVKMVAKAMKREADLPVTPRTIERLVEVERPRLMSDTSRRHGEVSALEAVRPEVLARAAKKAVEASAPAQADGKSAKPATPKEKPKTANQILGEAVNKYNHTVQSWKDHVKTLIFKDKSTTKLQDLAIMLVCGMVEEVADFDYRLEYWSDWCNQKPKVPKPMGVLPAGVQVWIDRAFLAADDLLTQIAAAPLSSRSSIGMPHHPMALQYIAKKLGLKINPIPAWSDFDPLKEKPAVVKQPAAGEAESASPVKRKGKNVKSAKKALECKNCGEPVEGCTCDPEGEDA